MTSLQVGFPIEVRALVPPFLDGRHLFGRPNVEVNGFDFTYVRSHTAMNPGASNADKHTDIPRGPSWIVLLTISTHLVLWSFHKLTERTRVLFGGLSILPGHI